MILLSLYTLKRPYQLSISLEDPILHDLQEIDFKENSHDNLFTIRFEDAEMINDNLFFLVLESDNPEFVLSILGED